MEEFAVLWLQQLGQGDFHALAGRALCVLARAHKELPTILARSRIGSLWMQEVDALTQRPGPFTCSPEDLSRSNWRLGQMPSEDAVELVHHVVSLCPEQRQAEESNSDYLEM
ncbi:GIP [Symbiodinium sp. CCMP2592]|nr:GIP [Symbiodinium sp. CCMP2592]